MSIDSLADKLIERIGKNFEDFEKRHRERATAHMVEEAKQVFDAVETVKACTSADLPSPPHAAPPKSNITNIRRAVCTLANAIKKLSAFGCSLSKAFKKAWGTVKAKTISTNIDYYVGNSKDYQERLEKLQSYHPTCIAVELRREVHKVFEEELYMKSVAVWVSIDGGEAYNLGYIKKDVAKYVAKMLDNGVKLAAKLHNADGGSFSNPKRVAKIDINF